MSSLGDRLDRLERGLSPTEAVLAWLETAHAHGGRVAYLQALVTDPPAQPPLESIVEQATSWAERNRSGLTRRARSTALRDAQREAVFAYELANGIDHATETFIDRFELVLPLALHSVTDAVIECREATAARPCFFRHSAPEAARFPVAALRHQREARRQLEAEHLAGASSLFPDTAERWARLERTAEVVADMIERAPVCTGPRCDGVEPDRTFDDEEEVTRHLASMRDDALFETHRYLGEDDEAEIIARRRVMAMR